MNQTEPLWNSLEVVKLIINVLTPLLLLFLGLWVNRTLKHIEASQWANQKVIEKKLMVFDETASLLNDLFCYYTLKGNWKELTPPQVIEIKRKLDKKIYVYKPLFSQKFFDLYLFFMFQCFLMNKTDGDAKLRTTTTYREKVAGVKWNKSWNKMFENERNDKEISNAYYALMDQYAVELGVGLQKY